MPFNHENVEEKFNIIQFIGFVFLVFGNLIYNEIIGINSENILNDNKYNSLSQNDENENNTADVSENSALLEN